MRWSSALGGSANLPVQKLPYREAAVFQVSADVPRADARLRGDVIGKRLLVAARGRRIIAPISYSTNDYVQHLSHVAKL